MTHTLPEIGHDLVEKPDLDSQPFVKAPGIDASVIEHVIELDKTTRDQTDRGPSHVPISADELAPHSSTQSRSIEPRVHHFPDPITTDDTTKAQDQSQADDGRQVA